MRRRLLPWLLLTLALLAVYAPLLVRGSAYRHGDLHDCTMPLLAWKTSWLKSVAAGDRAVPAWNPHILGGRPEVVDGTVYTILYPPTLAYLAGQRNADSRQIPVTP
ncbi:MAG TPA: hypothetical protein PKM88_10230, partial [bacterium]|nr:hypothetical protein [bacterium]